MGGAVLWEKLFVRRANEEKGQNVKREERRQD